MTGDIVTVCFHHLTVHTDRRSEPYRVASLLFVTHHAQKHRASF